jgi:tetratricopeptide (TPR) repeat protein
MLLRSLGMPSDQIPVDEAEASARYRSLLADRRVLVVLDNARSVDQVRPLLPASPGCLALVTSRERLAGLVARDGARRITLDVLTGTEAEALLAHLLGNDRVQAEPQAVAVLAKACAFLPLALRIAGAILDEHPRRLIRTVVTDLTTGQRLSALALADDVESAVRATFDLSYGALPEPAQRVFRLLGLVPGPDFTTDAAAALADLPHEEVRPLLDRLASAHLIQEHSPGRYTFHDLLRLYARDQAHADTDDRTAMARLLTWYLGIADVCNRLLSPSGFQLPLPPDLAMQVQMPVSTPHDALTYMDAECANLVAAVEHAAEIGPRRYAWLLADRLREYLIRRVDVRGLAVGRAGLRAAEAEGNALEQAAARIAVGNFCFWRADQHTAAVHFAQASMLAEQGDWPQGQAMAENNLALTHLDEGRPADAVHHLAQAYELNRQLGNLAYQASNLGNLGYARFVMGDLDRARSLWEEALTMQREVGNLIGEALSHTNLGNVSWLLGRLDVARHHLIASLRLRKEVGDRYHECYAKRTLACVLCDAGQKAEALSLATDALSVIQGVGAATEEAYAANALASVYCSLGRYNDATVHYERALDIGRSSPQCTLDTLLGVAVMRRSKGDAVEASEQAHRALAIAREIGNRVGEGRALTVLAEAMLDQGQTADARVYAERALDNHRDAGHRLGVARTLAVLGGISHADGDAQTALQRWQAARELFEDIGAPVPADVTEGMRWA